MVFRSSSPRRRLFLFERDCELLQLGVVKGTRLRRREKASSLQLSSHNRAEQWPSHHLSLRMAALGRLACFTAMEGWACQHTGPQTTLSKVTQFAGRMDLTSTPIIS